MFKQFYQQEVTASTLELGDFQLVYYPQGVNMVGSPIGRARAYVYEQKSKTIVYVDVIQRRGQWILCLSLHLEWWGTACEHHWIFAGIEHRFPCAEHSSL